MKVSERLVMSPCHRFAATAPKERRLETHALGQNCHHKAKNIACDGKNMDNNCSRRHPQPTWGMYGEIQSGLQRFTHHYADHISPNPASESPQTLTFHIGACLGHFMGVAGRVDNNPMPLNQRPSAINGGYIQREYLPPPPPC